MDHHLESLLIQFEESWNPQRDLGFSAILTGPAADLQPASRRWLIEEMIKVDLELSWRQGCQTRLEAYSDVLPEIPLDLLIEEYQVRHRWGDQPEVSEYTQRFGDVGRELAAHIKKTIRLDETECTTPQNTGPSSIGRFRVIRQIGEGSFAKVFLARDPMLDRYVALKVPLQNFQCIEEAVLAASASHPAFVAIYDVLEQPTGHVIVMEYINGGTYDNWCASPNFNTQEAILKLADVAEGLHEAHRLGLVHCDVKPTNILIDEAGQPRIADFGLAVRSDSQGSLAGDGLFGTPAYMSPEQARGETKWLDARTDAWAAGVILYQTLTKQLPFHGGNVDMLFDQILYHDPQPLRDFGTEISKELEDICSACLTKDIWNRIDCEQLAARLRQASSPTKAQTPQPSNEVVAKSVLPSNLPEAQLFVGRHEELDKCRQHLATDSSIIVNVHGPGGIGKTTLITELIRQSGEQFDANLYITLAHVSDELGLRNAIKSALGIESENDQNIVDTLRTRGKVLIVFDNFEQIGDGGTKMLDTWAEQLPFAKWVISSRRRLKLRRERIVPLGALKVRRAESEDQPFSESVELFNATALRVAPDFDEMANVKQVEQICDRLDGIPLAIELAASRVALLEPEQILSRIAEPSFLSSDDLLVDERHRTLQQAVDWSLELLGNQEWFALQQLSVLPAGCSVSLAEQLLDVERPLDCVQELANHSMLQLISTPFGKRISIYQPVLDVVRNKIDLDYLKQLRIQATETILPHCVELQERLQASPAKALIDELLAEKENLQAIQNWSTNLEDIDVTAQCTICVAVPLHTRGLLTEEYACFEKLGPPQAFLFSARLRARIVIAMAHNALDRGDLETSERLATQAETIVSKSQLAGLVCACDILRGAIHIAAKQWDKAGDIFTRLDKASELTSRERISVCLNLSRIRSNQGEIASAKDLLSQAYRAANEMQNPLMTARVLRHRGNLLFRHAQLDEAERDLRESEKLSRQAEFPRETHLALTSLGIVCCEQSKFKEAVQRFDEAKAIALLIGGQRGVAVNEGNRGVALAGSSDHVAAIQCLARAEQLNEQLGNEAAAALNRTNSALSVAALGDQEEAMARLASAIELLDRFDDRTNAAIARGDLGIIKWLASDEEGALDLLKTAWQGISDLELEHSGQAAPIVVAIAEISEGEALTVPQKHSLKFFLKNPYSYPQHVLLPNLAGRIERLSKSLNL